ncbi:MAG: tyrosine--tRNA ligase [Flavobacteriales bacterium]|jgi:tyrosyl-tRNA synthetase|nr:tyrosine--tRNA ligase [Flavobacteriales bacterium]NCG29431.1 tyrosine--tRNA ligase [Bacteroidota bacterium]MBT3963110.1 tyrosine--tRNA ligase [Flavobacteriales bacterium]MBT4706068.1 tyrosine--tRNA ligase [Flavobacteriales bacterium]MBT4930685.1 tyrosine--tRNA ligase [Flavobacteriales bacterium]
MANFVDELRWRGMLHDMVPGTDELLANGGVTGYIGFDPTADSLGIGNMVQVMILTHFQRTGNKPIALVGGATGMVGDPSGKSAERNLLDADTLNHNLECQRKQLEKFLDFEGENAASIVNNYDWFKEFGLLEFIRDVGKHIPVNYMMAKDSVKSRLDSGMSFTEFTYQLIQGYDFYHLWKHNGCKIQMGGSDQWGNITTGTELIRRMEGGDAYALTTPLIKKADGTKFGKTEGGNIWLDPKRTSPYRFYQFLLNTADADVGNYLRVFSIKGKDEIEAIEAEHAEGPHMRTAQKALAAELTARVHSNEDLEKALNASEVLFGKATSESLKSLDEATILDVFEGVPQAKVSRDKVSGGIDIVELLSAETGFLASNGEARRALKENSISVNKAKVGDGYATSTDDLIDGKYLLLQRGKKNYFLVITE